MSNIFLLFKFNFVLIINGFLFVRCFFLVKWDCFGLFDIFKILLKWIFLVFSIVFIGLNVLDKLCVGEEGIGII